MVAVLSSPFVQPIMGETEQTVDYGGLANVRFGSKAAVQIQACQFKFFGKFSRQALPVERRSAL
jgi:hypothetical protein